MKICELHRILNVARDWAQREQRTYDAKVTFLLGVHAAVQALDGMNTADVQKVWNDVSNAIEIDVRMEAPVL